MNRKLIPFSLLFLVSLFTSSISVADMSYSNAAKMMQGMAEMMKMWNNLSSMSNQMSSGASSMGMGANMMGNIGSGNSPQNFMMSNLPNASSLPKQSGLYDLTQMGQSMSGMSSMMPGTSMMPGQSMTGQAMNNMTSMMPNNSQNTVNNMNNSNNLNNSQQNNTTYNGVWIGDGGDTLIIEGSQFKMFKGQNTLQGLVTVSGNVFNMMSASSGINKQYMIVRQGEQFLLRDNSGVLLHYKRVHHLPNSNMQIGQAKQNSFSSFQPNNMIKNMTNQMGMGGNNNNQSTSRYTYKQ